MKTARKKRLFLVLVLVTGISIAAIFILYAIEQNKTFYVSPSEVKQGLAPANQIFRLGGMVAEGSFNKDPKSLKVFFDLTDYKKTVNVVYTGILPDLFREGQGIISKGKLNSDGVFIAEEVLAKHDENYMPPEVAESLEKAKNNKQSTNPQTQK